jgi:hypothetical protein
MLQSGSEQGFDQLHTLIRAQDFLLVLQTVTGAHVVDNDR